MRPKPNLPNQSCSTKMLRTRPQSDRVKMKGRQFPAEGCRPSPLGRRRSPTEQPGRQSIRLPCLTLRSVRAKYKRGGHAAPLSPPERGCSGTPVSTHGAEQLSRGLFRVTKHVSTITLSKERAQEGRGGSQATTPSRGEFDSGGHRPLRYPAMVFLWPEGVKK
jgi:hypothetical protein